MSYFDRAASVVSSGSDKKSDEKKYRKKKKKKKKKEDEGSKKYNIDSMIDMLQAELPDEDEERAVPPTLTHGGY